MTFVYGGCAAPSVENRPFFQQEYAVQTHGRKTWFDHLVEVDPGSFKVDVAADYLQVPPARIAILPFTDQGSANFVVDKIPLSHRTGQARLNWAWTDAQRLRRALDGYLSQREFTIINLDGIDAVLAARGITDRDRLAQISPQELGRWFNADAVVYGTLETYEAFYVGLIAGWHVRVDIRMVSTHSGEQLIRARGSRFDTNLMIALTPEDILINSAQNILQLRDINLARSEEETCREIVLRVPISEQLVEQNRMAALDYVEDSSPKIAARRVR